ncbi:MAG TPA: hypothetical protein VMF32_20255, partial [Xanthobacteraceae bacterium]|nr:hypothetical protein [Xanthobacteraceae bacterium]
MGARAGYRAKNCTPKHTRYIDRASGDRARLQRFDHLGRDPLDRAGEPRAEDGIDYNIGAIEKGRCEGLDVATPQRRVMSGIALERSRSPRSANRTGRR